MIKKIKRIICWLFGCKWTGQRIEVVYNAYNGHIECKRCGKCKYYTKYDWSEE